MVSLLTLLLALLLSGQVPAQAAQDGCSDAIAISEARRLPLGTVVTVQGIVTVPTGVFTPDQSFALEDGTGGLYIFRAAGLDEVLSLGDMVCVAGRLDSYRGLLELEPGRSSGVRRLASGSPPTALVMTPATLGEASEGRLVAVSGEVTDIASRSFSVGGARIYLDEDARLTMDGLTPGCQAQITGLSADFDGPQLWPRFASDVVALGCPSLGCPDLTVADIQGTGRASPYAGRQGLNCLSGCVTGVAADGFFLQDLVPDGDPNTSDGLFVYRHPGWDNPRHLDAGDLVEIRDFAVQEYFGSTEVIDLADDTLRSISLHGACDLPAPTPIPALWDPTVDPEALYERFEGMRVSLTFEGMASGPTTRYPSRFPSGEPEIAVVDRRSPYFGRRIFGRDLPVGRGLVYLSGGLGIDLPDVATGDGVWAQNLTGILAYRFERYVLLVDDPGSASLQVTTSLLQSGLEQAETPKAGEYRLCSFNMENLFDHVDDGDGDVGDWSPVDAEAYRHEMGRRVAAIRDALAGCAVIALQEVEGKDAVWQELAASSRGYAYDYLESADERDITVGILYDPAIVELESRRSLQVCSPTDFGVDYAFARGPRSQNNPCATGGFPLFTRPPYRAEVTLFDRSSGRSHELTLIVSHLKSKRGEEEDNAPLRLAQAQALAEALAKAAQRGAGLAVALGDFNDDLKSPTLDRFGDFVNLYSAHLPETEWYSFIYNGRSEALDHFVMTAELDRFFRSGTVVRINADYPDLLAPDASGRRSSDHDPIVARFCFSPTGVTDALGGAVIGAAQALGVPDEIR